MVSTDQLLESEHRWVEYPATFTDPVYQYIRDVKDKIAFQVEQIQHDLPLLDHVWFEKFVADPNILGGIRRTAHHLIQETSFNRAVSYLELQQDGPTTWSLRTLLRAIERDRQSLQQFEEVWENITFQEFADFTLFDIIKETYLNIIRTISECYTERIILFETAYNQVSKAINNKRGDYEITLDLNSTVETFYHVSIFAHQISQQDLDDLAIIGRSYLSDVYGNGFNAETEFVSFVSDLFLAREIVRVLREIIQIANGDSPLPTYQAYLDYLASSDQYNPVFLENTEKALSGFKGVRPDEVGIIECTVTVNEDVEYLKSLREFRLPVDNIVNIN